MVQKFYRKEETRKISGLGYTEFYDAIKEERFPRPDGYLGLSLSLLDRGHNWEVASRATGK